MATTRSHNRKRTITTAFDVYSAKDDVKNALMSEYVQGLLSSFAPARGEATSTSPHNHNCLIHSLLGTPNRKGDLFFKGADKKRESLADYIENFKTLADIPEYERRTILLALMDRGVELKGFDITNIPTENLDEIDIADHTKFYADSIRNDGESAPPLLTETEVQLLANQYKMNIHVWTEDGRTGEHVLHENAKYDCQHGETTETVDLLLSDDHYERFVPPKSRPRHLLLTDSLDEAAKREMQREQQVKKDGVFAACLQQVYLYNPNISDEDAADIANALTDSMINKGKAFHYAAADVEEEFEQKGIEVNLFEPEEDVVERAKKRVKLI